ncbi:MAG: AraC family transcriptional regulator, partial [Cyanobacteria bacterium P01_C01_bin.120]
PSFAPGATMKTPLTINRFDDWFLPGTSNDSRLYHADDSDRMWVCSPNAGKGYSQTITLQDDLTLEVLDYTLNQDRVFDRPGKVNCLEFEFRLAGPDAGYCSFVPYFGLKEFGVKPSQKRCFNVEVWFKRPTLITYFQAFMERLSPQARGTAERIVQLIYRHQGGGSSLTPIGMLNQIFDYAEIPGHSCTLEQMLTDSLYVDAIALNDAARNPITPAMEQVIERILGCSYQGKTRRTYLKHQAIELVDLYLEAMVQRRISETSLDYIYQAGIILRNQLVNPPTIEALARQVGTNRFYLYQGFQQMYGTTPFGYLRDCRLLKARQLLMTSELSIGKIATAVGYTSRSNFALAFRQQIGLNPKAFQMEAWQGMG